MCSEDADKITFEISGKDYESLLRFRSKHKRCMHGTAGDQYTYTFIPTTLGTAVTVTCSYGMTLSLGDFLDRKGMEADVEGPMTADEAISEKEIGCLRTIIALANPRVYRIGFQCDSNFDDFDLYLSGVVNGAGSESNLGTIIRDCESELFGIDLKQPWNSTKLPAARASTVKKYGDVGTIARFVEILKSRIIAEYPKDLVNKLHL